MMIRIRKACTDTRIYIYICVCVCETQTVVADEVVHHT